MTRTRFARVCVPALFLAVFAAAFSSAVAADDYAPMVTMSIQPPSGAAQTVEVRESLTGMIKVGNVEYKFRPTINDAKPWTKVTVTIFKGATATAADSVLGTVEVTKGAAAVASTTNPVFRVAVPKITAAPNPAEKK
jgi:hypothetical protein